MDMETRKQKGFTLIELLVVVAIIAVLISVLLPSLSKARAQARTTLCATRISQLIKGLFLYAEDYEERFPFLIVFVEKPAWGGGGIGGVDELDPTEDWIASEEDMPNVFFTEQADWDSLGVDCPRSGCLFPYTRFEQLYACPEFVRRAGNGVANISFDAFDTGDQRAFNYVRGAWCRKPNFQIEGGIRLEFDGPILTRSKVYSTGAAFLLLDEAWYANVGKGVPSGPGQYLGADPVWDMASSQGIYHGAPVPGDVWYQHRTPNLQQESIKRGSVSYYDGHVALSRDPCPLVDANSGRPTVLELALAGHTEMLRMMETIIYSLQGTVLDLP